jgi:hypothetical protein
MENKKCSTCKETKDINDFGKLTRMKDGKHYSCKTCNTKASRKSEAKYPERKKKTSASQYEGKTLPYYVVYCLPDFNGTDDAYVGKTNNPYYRTSNHRRNGNDTKEWFILGVAATDKEALAVEATYHALGYEGASNNKIYN